MDSKKNIELIILEVLGCLNIDDRSNIQSLKETDENFPWKTLAEFQNLSALFPSVLKVSELPSALVKEKMIDKLNNSISSEISKDQSSKFSPALGENHERIGQLEEVLTKNKIDWGSLAVSTPSPKQVEGYEEVKPKVPTIKKDLIELDGTSEITNDVQIEETLAEESKKEKVTNTTSSSKLKKYVMISIILFVISLTLFGYLFIFKPSDVPETLAEDKSNDKAVTAPNEEFVYNNIQDLENIEASAEVQQTEVKSKTEVETKTQTSLKENNKNLLPKAPPKLPEPIEAPLIETTQITSTEEANEKEELNVPPPKEVIEETEEPTYFIAVEEMPEPIGGLTAIQQKIVYPELARRAGVQGKVYIRAFVDEDGNVTNAEVVKGIGGGCDEAALDAILKTKFTPGRQRGKPIKVQVTVPVLFKL